MFPSYCLWPLSCLRTDKNYDDGRTVCPKLSFSVVQGHKTSKSVKNSKLTFLAIANLTL